MAKFVTDATAQRLVHLLNRYEQGGGCGARGGSSRWVLVRCTSAVAIGGNSVLAQCYPAIILTPASDYAAPPEEAFGCLLTLLGSSGNAVVPTAGQVYAGLLTSEVESDQSGSGSSLVNGRPRVFSVPAATAATTSPWKPPVRARTTAALPANTYANGTSGIGATLTGAANGALAAQDGVTLAANHDLLVANEVTAANNGIYTLTQVGSAGTPYILTRRTDADEPADLLGAVVAVEEGATYHDTVWLSTADATITVGTTALPWVKVGPYPSPLTTKGDVWGYSTTDARIPVGADGTVLTADSTQALGVRWGAAAAAPTDTYGQNTSTGTISLTVDDAYVDVASVSLPSAGTYEITAALGCNGQVSALVGPTAVTAQILGQLYDATNGVVKQVNPGTGGAQQAGWVALAIQVTNVGVRGASAFRCQITVAGAITLKLQAARQSGPTWTFAQIFSVAPEPSFLGWRKML